MLADSALRVKVCVVEVTVCINAGDALLLKFRSPEYCAVMLCAPTDSEVVEKAALPPAKPLLPIIAVPSRKSTVPVIVPAACELTVAVNVMDCPNIEGFAEEASDVVVAALAVPFTVCKMPEELAGAKVESPL